MGKAGFPEKRSLPASGGRSAFFRLRPEENKPEPTTLKWRDPALAVAHRRGARAWAPGPACTPRADQCPPQRPCLAGWRQQLDWLSAAPGLRLCQNP